MRSGRVREVWRNVPPVRSTVRTRASSSATTSLQTPPASRDIRTAPFHPRRIPVTFASEVPSRSHPWSFAAL
jgi:hypothetical protein